MIIRIKKDGKLIQRFNLEQLPITIGRSATCEVQLYDSKISRKHLKVINQTTSVLFEDLDSKHGTFFKGARVPEQHLSPGQSLRIANYIITVEAVDQAHQKTMPHITDQATQAVIEDASFIKTEVAIEDVEQFKTEVALDTSSLFLSAEDISDAPEEDYTIFRSPNDKAVQDKTLPMLSLEDDQPLSKETSNPIKDADLPSGELPSTDAAPKSKNLLGDSFMKAIAVSDSEEDNIHLKDSKALASPLPSKELDLNAMKETIKVDSTKIDVKNRQDIEGQVISQTNPLFSKRIITPSKEDNNIQFSSMASGPKKQSGLSEDFLKNIDANANDAQAMMETKEIDLRKTDLSHSSKTQIRNFQSSVQHPSPKSKSRHKIYMYGFISLLIASLLLLADKDVREQLFSSSEVSNKKSPKKNTSGTEEDRITRFKIEKIKTHLGEKNIEAAHDEMRVLLTEYPDNAILKAFLPNYKTQKKTLEDERKALEEANQKKQDQIKLFTQQAQKFFEDQSLDAALETFQKVLELDPESIAAQDGITQIESLKIQNERKAFAKRRKFQTLDRIFKEGIQKFEAGEFGKAKGLFKKVTEERGHPKYKQAKNFLSQIATQTDGALKAQIEEAKSKMNNILTLPESYLTLKNLTKQFPQHSQAKAYFQQAKDKMHTKAKQLYAEAIAQEELAGDFGAALDLYHEVLVYAPDSDNTYHNKAKGKIAKLQS